MSHKKLRQEKNCLNCGETVEDRFCSHCGQENLELKDTATHLVLHYVQDLFHYDGKLWHTLKSLVTHPGLVAAEYMEGKRQRHLEPIRFYVFASTVFFLTFFIVLGDDTYQSDLTPATNYTKRLYNLNQEKSFLAGTADTSYINPLIANLQLITGDTIQDVSDTSRIDPRTARHHVSADTQSTEGWLSRAIEARIEARTKELEAEHEGDEVKLTGALINEVVHTLPQLFFLSLPFFALFLKLLYWRSGRRKYVEHFIFSIYHYAYLFTIMLFYIIVGWGMDTIDGKALDTIKFWFTIGLALYPFIYLWLAMKRFYQDHWIPLTIRYILVGILFIIIIIALFILLALLTFLW